MYCIDCQDFSSVYIPKTLTYLFHNSLLNTGTLEQYDQAVSKCEILLQRLEEKQAKVIHTYHSGYLVIRIFITCLCSDWNANSHYVS